MLDVHLSDCLQRSHGNSLSCGHEPPHPFAPVSLNASVLEESVLTATHSAVGSYYGLSRAAFQGHFAC